MTEEGPWHFKIGNLNTPKSVLAYIDAHLDRWDIPDPVELARELGYTPTGYRKLQERHGDKLATHLMKLKRRRDREAEPLLLPKNAGAYVHSPFAAMPRGDEDGPELEAVDPAEIPHFKRSVQTKAQHTDEKAAYIAAMKRVEAELTRHIKGQPEMAGEMRRARSQIRKSIEKAETQYRRIAA